MWGEYFFIEGLEQALRVMRTGSARIVSAAVPVLVN
jgi:hypothetical protein